MIHKHTRPPSTTKNNRNTTNIADPRPSVAQHNPRDSRSDNERGEIGLANSSLAHTLNLPTIAEADRSPLPRIAVPFYYAAARRCLLPSLYSIGIEKRERERAGY